jgi:predicted PurR-regulated permease PerM
MPVSSTTRRDLSPAKTGNAVLLFGTVAVLYFARDILVPLAFAFTLAFLLTPAVSLLERIKIRRVPAVILTVFIAVAVIGWSGWLIANQLVRAMARSDEPAKA